LPAIQVRRAAPAARRSVCAGHLGRVATVFAEKLVYPRAMLAGAASRLLPTKGGREQASNILQEAFSA
jgi:hypothetical protein